MAYRTPRSEYPHIQYRGTDVSLEKSTKVYASFQKRIKFMREVGPKVADLLRPDGNRWEIAWELEGKPLEVLMMGTVTLARGDEVVSGFGLWACPDTEGTADLAGHLVLVNVDEYMPADLPIYAFESPKDVRGVKELIEEWTGVCSLEVLRDAIEALGGRIGDVSYKGQVRDELEAVMPFAWRTKPTVHRQRQHLYVNGEKVGEATDMVATFRPK